MRLATLRLSDGAAVAAVERGGGWHALDSLDVDVLRTAIDGIGTLTNRIRITARPPKEQA